MGALSNYMKYRDHPPADSPSARQMQARIKSLQGTAKWLSGLSEALYRDVSSGEEAFDRLCGWALNDTLPDHQISAEELLEVLLQPDACTVLRAWIRDSWRLQAQEW